MSVATMGVATAASAAQVERLSHGQYTVTAGRIVPKAKAIAYNPTTLPPSPSRADVNAGLKPPGKVELIPGESSVPVIGAIGEGLNSFGEDIAHGIHKGEQEAASGVSSFAKDRAEELIEGGVEVVKPLAVKVSLYAVLIFGAVAMVIFGASELLKPVGGPDLAGKAKGLVKP